MYPTLSEGASPRAGNKRKAQGNHDLDDRRRRNSRPVSRALMPSSHHACPLVNLGDFPRPPREHNCRPASPRPGPTPRPSNNDDDGAQNLPSLFQIPHETSTRGQSHADSPGPSASLNPPDTDSDSDGSATGDDASERDQDKGRGVHYHTHNHFYFDMRNATIYNHSHNGDNSAHGNTAKDSNNPTHHHAPASVYYPTQSRSQYQSPPMPTSACDNPEGSGFSGAPGVTPTARSPPLPGHDQQNSHPSSLAYVADSRHIGHSPFPSQSHGIHLPPIQNLDNTDESPYLGTSEHNASTSANRRHSSNFY
ncbi:hypothetical protein D9758_009045 [Tetrapyrgos nigripes]|uniref:Uncharacterized protein n=1 Tax=Tetrapyrgos nigripes TaxID=182062 RepID=A0A8H5LL59_9AGAR|nr:hypothetical protein D9758_009045 [Tetrapyrgos nigripes]